MPDCWTRVIALEDVELEQLRVHDLAPDLLMAPYLPGTASPRRNKVWTPFFCPKAFSSETQGITIDNFALKENKLKQ